VPFSVIPETSQIGGVDLPGLLALIISMVVVLAPLTLGRRASSGPSEAEPVMAGEAGPPRPADLRIHRGGIPLENAEPARVRLRNHERLSELLPERR
jgi:hypothetical protein